MAKHPKSVEIRTYQVGFGDCFLLSFVYGEKDKRHVLIDFGTTGLPGRDGQADTHMPRIANHIKKVCDGDGLTAVVATHRHADHINGFGTDGKTGKSGSIIASLEAQARPPAVDRGSGRENGRQEGHAATPRDRARASSRVSRR